MTSFTKKRNGVGPYVLFTSKLKKIWYNIGYVIKTMLKKIYRTNILKFKKIDVRIILATVEKIQLNTSNLDLEICYCKPLLSNKCF